MSLIPKDIANRKNYEDFYYKIEKGKLNKADGIIYTAKDSPKTIKYLKVRTKTDPDRDTLYGNDVKEMKYIGDTLEV